MRDLFYIGGGLAAGWVIGKILFGDREIRRNDDRKPFHTRAKDTVSIKPIKKIDAKMPSYAIGTGVWSTGLTGRYVLMQDGQAIGYIQGYGSSWNAYAYVDDRKITVALSMTRANAIGKVYAAIQIMDFLSRQRDYAEVQARSSRYYEMYREHIVWRARLVSADVIAKGTELPEDVVVETGVMLAKNGVIFGAVDRKKAGRVVRRFEQVEQMSRRELSRAHSQRRGGRRGRRGSIQVKPSRRVLASRDVSEMKKVEGLTPEEKRKLGRATQTVTTYSFALFGPDGSLGMFDYNDDIVELARRSEWTDAELRRHARRMRERAEEEAKIAEAELSILKKRSIAEATAPRAQLPFQVTEVQAMREMLAKPPGTYQGEFFERQHLDGLDYVSRKSQERQIAIRRVDRAILRVESLKLKLFNAREKKDAALAKGSLRGSVQAAAAVDKAEIELDSAMTNLDKAFVQLERLNK